VVDGLLAGLDLLLSDRGPPEARVFNLCTGIGTSVIGLADLLMTLAQRRIAVTHARPRDGDARASVGDPARARAALGRTAGTGAGAPSPSRARRAARRAPGSATGPGPALPSAAPRAPAWRRASSGPWRGIAAPEPGRRARRTAASSAGTRMRVLLLSWYFPPT